MPTKIRILTDTTINQIAAGEVIENPASVIKELVENSIDASSKKIQITINGGGFLSLQVTDDGIGMAKEDALLCFERHATSKITKASDMLSLHTMGFRGEALATIASIAHVELLTAEEGAIGTKVIYRAGKFIKVEPFSRRRGTTIFVSSLFFNVPARKKFQKSVAQSTQDIVKIVSRIALANKEIIVKLSSHDQLLLSTSSQKELRVEEILGKSFLQKTLTLSSKKNGYTLSGIIGSPENVKSNRLQQYLFVNQRPLFSKIVEDSVRNGFGTRISNKDHPIFLLWLDLPPKEIDINVHPQKTFIRFLEEKNVSFFIQSAIVSAFCQIPTLPLQKKPSVSFPSFLEEKTKDASLTTELPTSPNIQEPSLFEKRLDVLAFFTGIALVKIEAFSPSEDLLALVNLANLNLHIQFHRTMQQLKGEKERPLQKLLFPEKISVSKQESDSLLAHLDLFFKVGIELRPFGEKTFLIESLPEGLSWDLCKKLIEMILENPSKVTSLEQFAKMVSSFHSQKLYGKEEVKYLLQEALQLKDPFHAPNGKKTMIWLNQKDLKDLIDQNFI